MKVSVIIPTFNCARFIGEAVDSVLAQSYPAAEIIVVDDGSTDDTAERLRPYGKRIKYVRRENGGVAAARNTAIRLASGDTLAFLDSDDAWHPRKLELQVAYLRLHPHVGLLGTRIINWPRTPFASLPESETVAAGQVTFEMLAVKNRFVTSSMLVRKTIVEQAGEFDRQLHGPEDFDFWLRCVHFAHAANLELPLTGYRQLPGSLGKRAISMEAGTLRILNKLNQSGAWKGRPFLRRQAHAYTYFICAYMYAAAGQQRAALTRLLRSLLCFPGCFNRGDVRMACARPRLFCATLLRLLRLKSPHHMGEIL